MIWIVLVIVVVVLLVVFGVVGFNRLRTADVGAQEALGGIDVQLTRRADLIPNLVETVKGYAAHERETFEAVTAARAAAITPGSSPAEQAQQENVLTQALGRLFAVAEAYPELKANVNFLQLQTELTNTEDRVAAGRRFYNANVRELNTKIETVPTSIIASIFKFVKAEYFETEDPAARQAPTVSF